MGKRALRMLGLALAPLFLGACDDAAAPPPPPATDLAETAWIQESWAAEDQTLVFRRTDDLSGEVVGYAFGGDGSLVYRSFGWCATPPLTYFDQPGTWQQLDATHVRLDYPGALPAGTVFYEVVALTAMQLKLRHCDPLVVEQRDGTHQRQRSFIPRQASGP